MLSSHTLSPRTKAGRSPFTRPLRKTVSSELVTGAGRPAEWVIAGSHWHQIPIKFEFGAIQNEKLLTEYSYWSLNSSQIHLAFENNSELLSFKKR